MPPRRDLDVSVVLPFGDDEEHIGSACRRVAAHLRGLGLGFEILAVDENSTDNCQSLLALLHADLPELRVIAASGWRGGLGTGAREARGRVLWILDPRAALTPLAPFSRAFDRVVHHEADVIAVDHRYTVCHRTRCLPVIDGLRGRRVSLQERLTRRAAARHLVVERHSIGGVRPPRLLDRWARLLAAFAPARF